MLTLLAVVLDARSAPTPPVTSEMHARYLALAAARDAVIQGSVPEAAAAIGALSASDGSVLPFPDAWRPMDEAVREAARKMAQARDLPSAADRVAEVATSCAACHIATGGGPVASDPELPSQAWVEGQNMPLHRWALDWMWLGLVSDSDEAWLRGARELDDKPLALRFEGAATPAAQRAKQLEQQVYALAVRALDTEGAAARAALMGDLLATCASCHQNRPEAKR
jgi:mono/diheme cytochrome c family protein